MKSLSVEEGGNSSLHNNIIKESQLTKGYSFQKHHFPEFISTAHGKNTGEEERNFSRSMPFHDIDQIVFTPQHKKSEASELDAKLQQAKKEAYEQGFNQGRDEGIKKSKKDIEPLLHKFENALLELENTKKRIYTAAEKEAVDLSLAIAKKIVGNEIITNKNIIAHVVKEALRRVEGHDQITIKVNPTELNTINNARHEINEIVKCMEKVNIEGDDEIAAGGCVVHTNIGDIDARIEKQFDIVEEAFRLGTKPSQATDGII